MSSRTEVGVADFLSLMEAYLADRIKVDEYRSTYFQLMKQRTNFSEDEFRILQPAYGDADDYDAVVRLEYTIEEPELRMRVAKSVQDLKELGK